MKPPADWPFDQPRNAATVTTRHVIRKEQPITHVYHDEEDHGWQFHYAGPIDMADALLVTLDSIVDIDPTVIEIADFPPGWAATRERPGLPWIRKRDEY